MYEDDEEDIVDVNPTPRKLSKTAPPADEFNVGLSIRLLETRLKVLVSRRSRIESAIEGHQTAINGLKQILANSEF